MISVIPGNRMRGKRDRWRDSGSHIRARRSQAGCISEIWFCRRLRVGSVYRQIHLRQWLHPDSSCSKGSKINIRRSLMLPFCYLFRVVSILNEVFVMTIWRNSNNFWCLRTDSNRHGDMPQGILSPLCLPIPPLRLVGVRLPGRKKAVAQF